MLAQDLTTRAQFSIQIIIGGNSSALNECHILSRLGKHRNVIHFLGGVTEELDSSTGPIQECRMMFESIKGKYKFIVILYWYHYDDINLVLHQSGIILHKMEDYFTQSRSSLKDTGLVS